MNWLNWLNCRIFSHSTCIIRCRLIFHLCEMFKRGMSLLIFSTHKILRKCTPTNVPKLVQSTNVDESTIFLLDICGTKDFQIVTAFSFNFSMNLLLVLTTSSIFRQSNLFHANNILKSLAFITLRSD